MCQSGVSLSMLGGEGIMGEKDQFVSVNIMCACVVETDKLKLITDAVY